MPERKGGAAPAGMRRRMSGSGQEASGLGTCFLGQTPRDRRNSAAILIWTAIWAVTFTATLWTIKAGLAEGVLTWGLAALTAVTSIMLLRSYVRFVREADEMIQKLYVDALAFGFAAGAIFFAASEVLAALGGPVYDNNELFTAMCLAYAGKVVWNMWRLR